MKHHVRKFRSRDVALKELEPFIRSGSHLSTGRPFKRFNNMRSREELGNWLICSVMNDLEGKERYTFTSDPTGGDGIIFDQQEKHVFPTEHRMIPPAQKGAPVEVEALISNAVENKQNKGGSAYASGKTLVVFVEAGGDGVWYPNRARARLPCHDFDEIWVFGLNRVHQGFYEYGVSKLDADHAHTPVWLVRINPEFDEWTVCRRQ